MANTNTQLYLHIVFTVQNKKCIIQSSWKNELYKFITEVMERRGHRVLAINGMPDHVHVFFKMKPVQSVSEIMREVKSESSKWINEQDFLTSKFSWQEGFGAFSYGQSNVEGVINYLNRQELLHAQKSFLEEFKAMLELYEIEYDRRYLFKAVQY